MHLLIGGDGLVGTALRAEFIARGLDWSASSRREKFSTTPEWPQRLFLELTEPLPDSLPFANVVYLSAACPKFADCEGNALSWVVNVDAPIALARHYAALGTFVVFISSDAVEWCGMTAYGRQKTMVEAFMHTIDAAIMRPSRILPANVSHFASEVVELGLSRKAGVTRWWHDDKKVLKKNVA